MPKNRDLPLADWEVSTKLPSGAIMNVTIRATTLDHRDHAIVLLDTNGRSLFSAPASSSVVRRISDEDRKALREASAEFEQSVEERAKQLAAERAAAPAPDIATHAEPEPEHESLPRRTTRTKTR